MKQNKGKRTKKIFEKINNIFPILKYAQIIQQKDLLIMKLLKEYQKKFILNRLKKQSLNKFTKVQSKK